MYFQRSVETSSPSIAKSDHAETLRLRSDLKDFHSRCFDVFFCFVLIFAAARLYKRPGFVVLLSTRCTSQKRWKMTPKWVKKPIKSFPKWMLNLTASRQHFFFDFFRFRASLLGPVSAILGTKWGGTNLGICARDFFSFLGRARHLQDPQWRQKEPQRRPKVLQNRAKKRLQIIESSWKLCVF